MSTLTAEELARLGFWLPRVLKLDGPEGAKTCEDCGKTWATIGLETGNICDDCAREMFDIADIYEDRRLEAHYQIVAGTGAPAAKDCNCVHCESVRKEDL